MNKRGFTEKEAAEYVGFSPSTLRQGRMTGARDGRIKTPPYVRNGRSIRYLREDLDRWLEENRVQYSANTQNNEK
jgi:excisionase family DNA binding protein